MGNWSTQAQQLAIQYLKRLEDRKGHLTVPLNNTKGLSFQETIREPEEDHDKSQRTIQDTKGIVDSRWKLGLHRV